MDSCVIYVRSATGDRNQKAQQEKACRNKARELGKDILQIFEEDGGGQSKHRPALKELLQYTASQAVDSVICTDTCRISRDPQELLQIVKELIENNCDIHFVDIDFCIETDGVL